MIIEITNLETNESVVIKSCSIIEKIFTERYSFFDEGLYRNFEMIIEVKDMYSIIERIMECKVKVSLEQMRIYNGSEFSTEDRAMNLTMIEGVRFDIKRLEKIPLSLVKHKKSTCEFNVVAEPSDCKYTHLVPNNK